MVTMLACLNKAFVRGLVILDCFHTIKNAGVENGRAGEITGIPHVGRKVYCLPFLMDKLFPLEDW